MNKSKYYNLKQTIQFLLLIFFISMHISCTKELIIEPETGEDRIVVNGLINNMDTLSVTVTKSFSAIGKTIVEELETATVSVFENDVFIETMTYRKSVNDPVGKFIAGFLPSTGNNYKIIVSDNILGQAEASTSLPESIILSAPSASLTTWGENGWNKPRRYRYSFNIHDSDRENYYFLKIYMKIYRKDTGIDSTMVLSHMNGEVLSSSMPEQTKYVHGGLLFTDKGFNGNEHTIKGTATLQDSLLMCNSVPKWKLNEEERDIDCYDYVDFLILDQEKIYIELEVLSKETYEFYKSHAKIVGVNVDSYKYAEPSPVYGNVENGLGIFGGLNRKIVTIDLNN